MALKRILVDDAGRELVRHGTDGFPMTVNHDDLWAFEGRSVPIHWHDDIEISLPREGEAIYQIYNHTCTVHPGQALVINRSVPHSCHSPNDGRARYTTILVRPDLLYGQPGCDIERECFRPFLGNAALPFIMLGGAEKAGGVAIDIFDRVERAFDARPECWKLTVKGLLCQAFGEILPMCVGRGTKVQPAGSAELERLGRLLGYIEENYQSPVSLEALACRVHLSREACCRFFKRMTGKTITAYLEEYRADRSLHLVQSRQYSMAMIADMVGFSNASRFARAFRARFGLNPGEYCRARLEKDRDDI